MPGGSGELRQLQLRAQGQHMSVTVLGQRRIGARGRERQPRAGLVTGGQLGLRLQEQLVLYGQGTLAPV